MARSFANIVFKHKRNVNCFLNFEGMCIYMIVSYYRVIQERNELSLVVNNVRQLIAAYEADTKEKCNVLLFDSCFSSLFKYPVITY